jgi:cell division protein FtsN
MAIKKTTRKQATTLHGRPSGGSGWLTGLLVGLVIGGCVVFYLLAMKPTNLLTASPTETAENKKEVADKKKTGGPRFDFYKLLPENASGANANKPSAIPTQAPTPSAFDSDTDTTDAAATPSSSDIPVETHAATADAKLPGAYLLQAGSFRSNPDADKVRASIILLGLPSRVESVKNDKGETLYRVYVGSFGSAVDMQKAQTTLSANKINAVVVKPK